MVTREYDFERIYRNFFTILHKDFHLLNSDEAINFIYWSDDILYNIWKTKVDNRNLINFCVNANQHSKLTPNIVANIPMPEFHITDTMLNTIYLGEITSNDFYRIEKDIRNSKVLQKFFFVKSFIKNYYANNTINSGGLTENDYKYCIYITIKNQKDLETLTTYSRLIKK